MATDKKIKYTDRKPIIQGGVDNYLGKQPQVQAPRKWQSGPDKPATELAYITEAEKDLILKTDLHGSLKKGPNIGPSGIMSLDSFGDIGGAGASGGDTSAAGGAMSGRGFSGRSVAEMNDPRDKSFEKRVANEKATLQMAERAQAKNLGYRERENIANFQSQPKSRFGIGNMLSGALSMFGGWPGKAMSLLSRINPGKLRGWNEEKGRYNTQEEYEDARTNRRNTKNIDRILNRKAPITEMTYKNLARYGMNPEDMPGVGSTSTSRAIDKDYESGMNINEGPFAKSHLQSIDLSKYPVKNTNIISDYPNYRTPNLGGTYHFNRFNQPVDNSDVFQDSGVEPMYHSAKDGGRIGYENGELVTDESMMEATPAGMMQENVEEVQGEPTREELEALAIEIFQLPLEELNEEQLMIVYQAAMQQEPMQEDIQEEDVQYAAQGGLAGLL